MCIIVDANLQSRFMKRYADMKPVHDWIEKNGGKIAYSNMPKFENETIESFKKKLLNLRRRGRAKLIPSQQVKKQLETLLKTKLQSNDRHIIALALAAKVKVLITKDGDLEKDFKQHVRGKIYHNEDHKHLLKKDLCP